MLHIFILFSCIHILSSIRRLVENCSRVEISFHKRPPDSLLIRHAPQ